MTEKTLTRTARNEALRAAGGRCERCGASSKHGLEVRPLDSAPTVLEAVCRNCRGEGVRLIDTPERVYLKLGRLVLRAAAAHPIDSMSEFKARLQEACRAARVRYVPLHADKAMEQLVSDIFPAPPRRHAEEQIDGPPPLTRAEAADLWMRIVRKAGQGTIHAIPRSSSTIRIDATTTPDVVDLESALEAAKLR